MFARRNGIRTNDTLSKKLNIDSLSKVYERPLRRFVKKYRKRIVKYGLLTVNVLLLVAVVSFVLRNPDSGQAVRTDKLSSVTDREGSLTNPLDKMTSADIAVHLSRLAGMDAEQAVAVTNQADSVNIDLAIVSTGEALVYKPQVVQTALKSRKDIISYVTQPGDTISGLAARFGVTSDTLRWSNGINGERLPAGKEIWVLPGVNGIIYTVQGGDTPDSLAQKYNANRDKIIAYNDAELSGLPVGERIIIPDGSIRIVRSYASASGFAFGNSPIYGGNAYVRGYCTYYVASRVAVPNNWGNANRWASAARASGWTVSQTPVVGAIAQTTSMHPLGHVAYVEEVSEDGTMIKYSDMNGIAGFGRVGYSDWVPASMYQAYIYR